MRTSQSRVLERARLLGDLGMPPPWWRIFSLRRWLARYRSVMATDVSELSEMLATHYGREVVDDMAARPIAALRMLAKERRP